MSKMKIPESVKFLHEVFRNFGYELYLVGGCVRDSVMGIEPHDYDLVTNAFPDEIDAMFNGPEYKSKFGRSFKMDYTGKKFGVTRINMSNADEFISYEVATYRKDLSTGRKPEVRVGGTMTEDAKRRDFSINALYYDIANEKVIDILGGLDDLKNKIIRTPGKAKDRFNEDRTRILRACRFADKIGGSLDQDIIDTIKENNSLSGPDADGNLVPLTREMVTGEFIKGIEQGKYIEYYLVLLSHYGLLDKVFQGWSKEHGQKIHGMLIKSESNKMPNNLEIVIALLFKGEDPLNSAILLHDTLLFSNKVSESVKWLLKFMNISEYTAFLMKKWMAKTSLDNSILELYVKTLDDIYPDSVTDDMRKFLKYEIKTTGDMLLQEGFKPGRELGNEMDRREMKNFLNITI